MKRHHSEKQLCFDDILLVPQAGSVRSRADVDMTMTLGVERRPRAQITLTTPIIASPMDTVCDTQMAQAMSSLGGLGIIHRYMDRHYIVSRSQYLSSKGVKFGVSLSIDDTKDEQYVHQLLNSGVSIMCIDTANGHSIYTIDATERLRYLVPSYCHIMVGNVSTKDGLKELIGAGADSVRVGIGGGSACTTRIVSGHGLPTLASIIDCSAVSDGLRTSIIADGGIRNTGDMVKSFAAGASAVMLGNLLAGHTESPRKVDEHGKYVYRGMASGSAQLDWRGRFDSEEGVSGRVPERGPVEATIRQFRYGIASGCSYSGVLSLRDLFERARYVKVSSLTSHESQPRI
jgi:IMP dehydrogenase